MRRGFAQWAIILGTVGFVAGCGGGAPSAQQTGGGQAEMQRQKDMMGQAAGKMLEGAAQQGQQGGMSKGMPADAQQKMQDAMKKAGMGGPMGGAGGAGAPAKK
jgi:hypothetical protein